MIKVRTFLSSLTALGLSRIQSQTRLLSVVSLKVRGNVKTLRKEERG